MPDDYPQAVTDWFAEFAQYLVRAMPMPNWPEWDTDEGAAFWDLLKRTLTRKGATRKDAFETVMALAETGRPMFPGEFQAEFVELLPKVQSRLRSEAVAAGAGKDPSLDFQAAKDHQFKHPCPDCPGTGIATRYSWWPSKNAQGQERPANSPYSYFCTCPMGRNLERNADADTRRKVGDMANASHKIQTGPVPWSSQPDNQHRYRLCEWDEEEGRPKAFEFLGKSWSEIKAIVNARTERGGNATGGPLTDFTVPSSTRDVREAARVPAGPPVAISTPIRTSSHQSSHSGAAASF